jgi:hypothetical protein
MINGTKHCLQNFLIELVLFCFFRKIQHSLYYSLSTLFSLLFLYLLLDNQFSISNYQLFYCLNEFSLLFLSYCSNVLCFCSFYRSIKRSLFLFFLSFYQTFFVFVLSIVLSNVLCFFLFSFCSSLFNRFDVIALDDRKSGIEMKRTAEHKKTTFLQNCFFFQFTLRAIQLFQSAL